MKKIRRNKTSGITLIALVVTVIVLLILAGISIQMLTGDNGILIRVGEAKEKTELSQIEENRRLASMEAATNLTETTFQGVRIPLGFAPTRIEGESTVNEGLVIIDSKGNEYVWVEVPNDGSGPDYSKIKSNNVIDTNKIYTALKNYCSKDVNGNTLISDASQDVWFDSAGKKATQSTNLEDTEVCGLTSSQYTELRNKMLISIYNNGGFWIGRYEAGLTSPRGDSSETIEGIKLQSKQNLYPINFVSCKQAQTLASAVLTNERNSSSILFGIQWDLVIKFLSNKGIATDVLNVDSKICGNYCNNTFVINRGEYNIQKPRNVFTSYKIASDDNKVSVVNGISTKNRYRG